MLLKYLLQFGYIFKLIKQLQPKMETFDNAELAKLSQEI